MPKTWTPPSPATIEEGHRAFDAALVRPTYGEGHDRWPAYLNEDILIAFAEDDALGREPFVPQYNARMPAWPPSSRIGGRSARSPTVGSGRAPGTRWAGASGSAC